MEYISTGIHKTLIISPRRYGVILARNAHWVVSSEPSMCLNVGQNVFGREMMSKVT